MLQICSQILRPAVAPGRGTTFEVRLPALGEAGGGSTSELLRFDGAAWGPALMQSQARWVRACRSVPAWCGAARWARSSKRAEPSPRLDQLAFEVEAPSALTHPERERRPGASG